MKRSPISVIRDPNRRAGVVFCFALWLFVLIVNVVSGFGLGGFGVLLLVLATLVAVYAIARWRRVSLIVSHDGIVIRDLTDRTQITWDQITQFRYPYAGEVAPFLDRFWGRDVAVVDLDDGTTIPIPALRPAGQDPLILLLFALFPWRTKLDRVVARLNDLHRQHQLQRTVRRALSEGGAPRTEESGTSWTTVYDLRSDDAEIDAVQEATLHTANLGLKPEPALFGSAEWWAAIDGGRLPTFVLRGVVEDVFMTGHDDFPEFRIRLDDGSQFDLVRYGDAARYTPGARIRLTCVEQHFKDDAAMLDGERSSTIVALLVEIAV